MWNHRWFRKNYSVYQSFQPSWAPIKVGLDSRYIVMGPEKQQCLSIMSIEKLYQVGSQLRLERIFFISMEHFSQCRDHCTCEFSFPTCYGTRTNMKSSLATAKTTESINNCNGKKSNRVGRQLKWTWYGTLGNDVLN